MEKKKKKKKGKEKRSLSQAVGRVYKVGLKWPVTAMALLSYISVCLSLSLAVFCPQSI